MLWKVGFERMDSRVSCLFWRLQVLNVMLIDKGLVIWTWQSEFYFSKKGSLSLWCNNPTIHVGSLSWILSFCPPVTVGMIWSNVTLSSWWIHQTFRDQMKSEINVETRMTGPFGPVCSSLIDACSHLHALGFISCCSLYDTDMPKSIKATCAI